MITKDEIQELLLSMETYRVERTTSTGDMDKFQEAICANAMKTLGYVNMFNRGVGQVQADLKGNGNLPSEFNVNLITAFKVEVNVAPSYVTDNGGNVGGKNGGDVPSFVTSLVPRRRKSCKPEEENLFRRNGHLHSGILFHMADNG